MVRSRTLLLSVSVSAALLLAACDNAEERAQGHYENAVSLLEEGDVDRAVIELRNVFQLNGSHVEARKLFASVMLQRGNLGEAFSSYLAVAEASPDDLEARKALARIAFEAQRWDEFERHVTAAAGLAPEDPEVRLLNLAAEFRSAAIDDDAVARREAANQVRALLPEFPGDMIALKVLSDDAVRDQEFTTALEYVDAALDAEPDRRDFLQLRLALLSQLGDDAEVEAQLQALIERFPEEAEFRAALIRWYMSRDMNAKAEDVLRATADAPDAETGDRVSLVRFVQQMRGTEAALEEIERLLQAGQDTDVLRALRAGLTFDSGDREDAIAELQEVIAGGEPSDRRRDIQITLANMLQRTGDAVGARQLVEEVLAEDPGHVAALKMQAEWLIEQDQPDEAIVALRRALDQAPRDPQVLTLMASAHLRNGSRDLAGEMLSRAVESANQAPDESVRYARFLIEDERYSTAESVLIESLRLYPNELDILVQLGRVYVAQQDWPRTEQVEGTLSRLETEAGENASNALRVARLRAQDRNDEVVRFLEGVIQNQGESNSANLAIVRAHLQNGDLDAAQSFIDGELADDPEDRLMRFLKAGVLTTTGAVEEAETIYRALLEEDPRGERIWRTLYLLLSREGRFDEARATLEAGIAANENAPNLQWALAGDLERGGDFEGAIGIYENLYERNSGSVIVANNLASLITTYRDDEESLDRAWTIARRLRGTDVPAFQDTYGWIALRRGDVEEALAHLEPAAAALSGDPLVQYHLGVAYAEAGRPEDAIEQFRRAISIAGPADTRSQFATARAEIERLESELEAQ